jgi:histidinol-phosphate aminotransferase
VILDEAYVEFSLTIGDPFASLPLLDRHPNLVILRSFSKVYGLAGLRVGYGLCGSESFRIAVDQVRQPFYLSSAAQAAAVEALRHQDEVERRVVATVAARTTVTEALRERDLWVAESDANFLWVRLADDGQDGQVVEALRERGVLVRAGTALGGPGFARVTLGTDAENQRFLSALAEVL